MSSFVFRGLIPIVGSLLVVAVAVAAHVAQIPFAATMRNALFDAYQRAHPRTYAPVSVRIVDIDDESLTRIGQWPWPRTRLADLTERLRELGAAAIAFDIVFAEPDRTSPAELAKSLSADARVNEILAALPDPDAAFATAIGGGKVVTGFALAASSGGRKPAKKAGFVVAGDDPREFLPAYPGAVPTLAPLEIEGAGNGALNFTPGTDGVLRRLPLVFRLEDELYPSLAAEALRVAEDAKSVAIKTSGASGESRFGGRTGIVSVRIGRHEIPTDPEGQVWLHYSRAVGTRAVPAWRVFEDGLAREPIDGSIVLVGTSAAGLKDLRFSPLGGAVPGVEIHAQLLEQVLGSSALRRPDWATAGEVLFLIGASSALALSITQLGPVWSAALGALAVAAAFAGSWWAFVGFGLLLDPLFPSLAAITVYFVCSVPRHLQSERDRRWIRSAFSHYISPNLVNHLIAHPGELRLGGERRECSFILTDLANFTTLVERSDPELLLSVMNEYLDELLSIVFRHEGTLDRIVGDAFVVMFSAPVVQPDHHERALACALELDRAARDFSRRKQAEGFAVGNTRVGVNSGIVVVGNVGGKALFDYRALGDAINTAARLETVNRQLGTTICVSGATARRAPSFVGRPVGTLILKGKQEPVEAFEPLAADLMASPPIAAYLAAYQLLERNDPGALAAFTAIENDPLADFHRRRLESGETGTVVHLTEK